MLFCDETPDMLVDFFVKKAGKRKTCNLFRRKTILSSENEYMNTLNCLHFKITSAQNNVVLKRHRPTFLEPQTLLFVLLEKSSDLFLGSSTKYVRFLFLHNNLKNFVWFALWSFGGSITT